MSTGDHGGQLGFNFLGSRLDVSKAVGKLKKTAPNLLGEARDNVSQKVKNKLSTCPLCGKNWFKNGACLECSFVGAHSDLVTPIKKDKKTKEPSIKSSIIFTQDHSSPLLYDSNSFTQDKKGNVSLIFKLEKEGLSYVVQGVVKMNTVSTRPGSKTQDITKGIVTLKKCYKRNDHGEDVSWSLKNIGERNLTRLREIMSARSMVI